MVDFLIKVFPIPNIDPGPPPYSYNIELLLNIDSGLPILNGRGFRLDLYKSINLFLFKLNFIEDNSPRLGSIKLLYVVIPPIPPNGFKPCLLTCKPNATPPA